MLFKVLIATLNIFRTKQWHTVIKELILCMRMIQHQINFSLSGMQFAHTLVYTHVRSRAHIIKPFGIRKCILFLLVSQFYFKSGSPPSPPSSSFSEAIGHECWCGKRFVMPRSTLLQFFVRSHLRPLTTTLPLTIRLTTNSGRHFASSNEGRICWQISKVIYFSLPCFFFFSH